MTNTLQQQTPNPDEVICPKCSHQFRAIPENVQARLSTIDSAPKDGNEEWTPPVLDVGLPKNVWEERLGDKTRTTTDMHVEGEWPNTKAIDSAEMPEDVLPLWQEGIAGSANIVSYNGEDIVGIAFVNDDAIRASIIEAHNRAIAKAREGE